MIENCPRKSQCNELCSPQFHLIHELQILHVPPRPTNAMPMMFARVGHATRPTIVGGKISQDRSCGSIWTVQRTIVCLLSFSEGVATRSTRQVESVPDLPRSPRSCYVIRSSPMSSQPNPSGTKDDGSGGGGGGGDKKPGENSSAPSSPMASSSMNSSSNGGHQKGVSFDNLEPLLKAMKELKSAQQQQQHHHQFPPPSSPPLLSQPLLSGSDRPASLGLDASPRYVVHTSDGNSLSFHGTV